jgi:hypothetical protein
MNFTYTETTEDVGDCLVWYHPKEDKICIYRGARMETLSVFGVIEEVGAWYTYDWDGLRNKGWLLLGDLE